MRSIAQSFVPLRPHDNGDHAYHRFDADPNCAVLAVVGEDGRPVGLVERTFFLTQLAGQYGRSVYGNRPISLLMDRDPLLVDANARTDDFAGTALEQFSEKLRKGFIVVAEGGRYLGVGSITDLLKAVVLERTRDARKLELLAHYDSLTGLANRLHLHSRLGQAVARCAHGQSARSVALLAIDLDRFKQVNDTHGHDAGDNVLRQVGQRLKAALRPDDLAARLGGDEFAIVIEGPDAAASAERVAARVTACLRDPIVVGEAVVHIGGSIGIAVCPEDCTASDDLFKFADMALYNVKSGDKGEWRRFNGAMRAGLERRGALEADLRGALARGEFAVHLQPILRLDGDDIRGYEALMRWDHPVRGSVAPATFIPLAEDLGLISAMGDWMIREACALLRRLPAPMSISVNVSSVQFRLPGLVDSVIAALAGCEVAAGRLVLEITESVLINDEAQALDSIIRLRAAGVRIALDDFGTGFASFAYLQRFPFDIIKIDRSFIDGLPASRESRAIVSAVAVLAGQLYLTVIAEGVESDAQLAAIRQLGCHAAQGYLIGRPAPAGDIVETSAEAPCRAA